jgi:hypothetical protein
MVEVGVKDLVGISIALGVMVSTMASFLALFTIGLQGDLLEAVRIGVTFGVSVTVITLLYGGWRLFEIKRGGGGNEEVDKVAFIQDLLRPVEAHAAGLSWAAEKPWRVSTHIRTERGTLSVDLHDLDLAGSRRILDLVIMNRPEVGRIRLITGRGKHSLGEPTIRPMVNERLNLVATALDWQMIVKAGSVTLRPMGKRPTPKTWFLRFIVFVVPITASMALSFEDLAGSGAREQGFYFGIVAGIILTGLLASYRQRAT